MYAIRFESTYLLRAIGTRGGGTYPPVLANHSLEEKARSLWILVLDIYNFGSDANKWSIRTLSIHVSIQWVRIVHCLLQKNFLNLSKTFLILSVGEKKRKEMVKILCDMDSTSCFFSMYFRLISSLNNQSCIRRLLCSTLEFENLSTF